MTTWYLWAKNGDAATNRYLAQIVGAETEFDTTNMKKGMRCADGVERDLYVCPCGYEVDVKKAITAKPEFRLKFEVLMRRFDEEPTFFELWKNSVKQKAKVGKQGARIWHKRAATMPRRHKAKKPPRRLPF